MILDPIQRRFGYGAARLRIVRPDGVQALSTAARRPHPFENVFAVLPSLVCVGIAFLLFISIRLDGTSHLQTPLEIQLWSETARPVPALVAQAEIVQAEVAQATLPKPYAEPLTVVDSAETPLAKQSRPDFDLASIAMSAPKRIVPNIDETSPVVRITRPNSATSGPRLAKTELALSATAPPSQFELNRDSVPSVDTESHRGVRRPHESGRSKSAEALETWSGSGTRRQFLVAHAAMEAAGPQAAQTARPPTVSAAGLASARATNQVVRENLKHSAYGAGWQEVPLEELPDCSPAGRQDLFKKRILLAAPFERECSHQDGSYRFVETRNLGAFLMWSRTNPDRPAGQPRARNVCDVLERALRCLDASSIEESSAQ